MSIRRYSLRKDGFVSVNAPLSGGELLTEPITFEGNQLGINFATSGAGSIRVELQDADGSPIPGFALEECHEQIGDEIGRVVRWETGDEVGKLAGQPIRARFVLRDADLYALKFSGVTRY